MNYQGMNEVQVIAFWVWYKLGFNGDGRRSFAATAERISRPAQTISEWHKGFNWDKLAAEEDAKINRRLEREVQRDVVKTFKDALVRQQELIALLFARFKKLIPDLPANSLRVSDMIKLMEYETTYVFDEDRGKDKGNMLAVILQMMPPEDRTRFNATIERARDGGMVPLERLGPIGRN